MLKLVGGRPNRFFARGTVFCPACGRGLHMLDLGGIDDAFRLQCDGCGQVSEHEPAEVHVEIRPEARCRHRPF